MIQTILSPIDGSERSDKALDFALDLARKYDAKLRLLHVLMENLSKEELERMARIEGLAEHVSSAREQLLKAPPAQMAPGGAAVPSPPTSSKASSSDVIAELGEQILESAKRKVSGAGVTLSKATTAKGDAAKQILKVAEDESIDLIVMGTRGLGELKSLVLGSVSRKVSNAAPCSCVIVR